MAGITVKTLKLRGIAKDYEYSFRPGLNIISGPISTGKTSILEFIDYCFGANSHPEHIEIQKKARSALLETEINGETIVIERPLFTSERKATIHECSLLDIGIEHVSKVVQARQIPGQESISSYILNKIGLLNILLREAPTKDGSDVDMMSLRDIMWFCFLQNERLDNKELLFENVPVKNIKLHQVFNVIFKVHANELSHISLQIKNMESEISRLSAEIGTLIGFLRERRIPSRDKLEEKLAILSKSEIELKARLDKITNTLKGESNIAQQYRVQLTGIEDDLRQLSANRRDREKLLKRLLPLRGQYSEDTKKLHFLQEVKRIVDPLALIKCPYCLQEISQGSDIRRCMLCGNDIKIDAVESFDVKKEIGGVERKLKELNAFIEEIDKELEEINGDIRFKEGIADKLRKQLDEALKGFVSPYIAERDAIVGEINRIRQEVLDIETQQGLHAGIEERINKRIRLEADLKLKQAELESERGKVRNREEIINAISKRFGEILEAVSFPKIEAPKVNSNLVPFVRNLEYRKIGSSGAMTLLSVSWFLSIFECAIEHSGSHPGFVMIDSPQKNIGLSARVDEPEFRDTKIVEGLYHHIIEKASEYESAQWIIVDNEPPEIAREFIRIKFSRRKNAPPYGLIDDEVD